MRPNWALWLAHSRPAVFWLAFFLSAVLVAVRPLAAQVVRGSISDRTTGAPVAGVLVSLVDDSGHTLVTVLSNDRGAFEIRAPDPGDYTIDAKRIGVHRWQSTRFDVAQGETHHEVIRLDPVMSLLDRVQITGRSGCTRSPASAVETAAVWDDARAALQAAVVTARHPVVGTTTRFARVIDAETEHVERDDRKETHGPIGNPFVSISTDRLARDGYVVRGADGSMNFYAPDAGVLLSDEFVRNHCFHLVAGSDARPGMLGLGFEPVRDRHVADIQGVLWLRARTAELTDLEFDYVGLSREASSGDFGGHVRFARLPDGRWIVNDWVIRMPVFGKRARTYMTVPGGSPPLIVPPRVVLIASREEGGSVRLDNAKSDSDNMLSGIVFDSTSNGPLVGAPVFLQGTSFSATTDSVGHFRLMHVPSGRYTLTVEAKVPDSLGLPALSRSVMVSTSGVEKLELTIPSRETLGLRMCPMPASASSSERGAAIHIFVVDRESGLPLDSVPVRVWWSSYTGALSSKDLKEHVHGVVGRLDSAGSYTACDLPEDETIHVESVEESPADWSATFRVLAGEVGWRVLKVERNSTSS